MTDLWRLDARKAAAAIRSKAVSSSELLEVYLDRIDRHNPRLNAVVTIDADGARRAALAADDAVVRGEDLGPLHGLPITVKDALETKGIRSTGGATELRDHVPTEDAPAVARVKEAGAIVFAKTNAPKWSMNNQTHNELFGVTRNPWDDSRSPGGSSGGPAVSVACGFSAFEIGTDIGGSIRMPAHFTGICGHKPSFGIVPSRGYLDHIGGGLTEADINVVGPMARSVADLGLLLGILAGVDGDRRRRMASRVSAGPAGNQARRVARRSGLSDRRRGPRHPRSGGRVAADRRCSHRRRFAPGRLRGVDEGLLAADLLGHLARSPRRSPRLWPGRSRPSPNRPVKIRCLPWVAAR